MAALLHWSAKEGGHGGCTSTYSYAYWCRRYNASGKVLVEQNAGKEDWVEQTIKATSYAEGDTQLNPNTIAYYYFGPGT